MRKVLLAAAVAAIAFTSAPALARPDVCIRQDDLYNWRALSDKQVVIENSRHQKALLSLIGTCIGIRFHETIAIKSPGGTGLSCISPGDEILLRDRGMGTPERCAIIKVTPYAGNIPKHDDQQSGDQHDEDHHDSGDQH